MDKSIKLGDPTFKVRFDYIRLVKVALTLYYCTEEVNPHDGGGVVGFFDYNTTLDNSTVG